MHQSNSGSRTCEKEVLWSKKWKGVNDEGKEESLDFLSESSDSSLINSDMASVIVVSAG